MPALPDHLRDGRYELGEPLGMGGMAVVVRAVDTELGVERAIKVLLPDMARKSVRRRLQNEARAMARLGHPHILSIHDVGRDDDLDWIVMDLATGGSLQDLVGREGPLPLGTAIGLMVQVLSALAAAHAAGIVHRDVKPHNVLLDADGRALLADFGIAMLTEDDRTTKTGVAMGSMSFMPPEQRLDAARVGPQADLYATGCTLYALLTNDNPVDLFMAGPDSDRWDGVPPPVRAVVQTACAPHPTDRYADAGQMAHALLDVLDVLGDDIRESALPSRGFFPAPAKSTMEGRAPTKARVASATREALATARTLLPAHDPTRMPAPTAVPAPPPDRRPWVVAAALAGMVVLGLSGLWATGWTTASTAEPIPQPSPSPQATPAPAAPAAPAAAPPREPSPSDDEPADAAEPTAERPSPRPSSEPTPRAAPTPVPVPEPEVLPDPPAEGPFGRWEGSLNGTPLDLVLRGSAEQVTGTATLLSARRGDRTESLVGTYDPERKEVRVTETTGDRTVPPGTYVLTWRGDTLSGRYEAASGGRVVSVAFQRP